MINSLDEAIKHCEEVAEKNEKECKNWAYGASQINDDESRKKQYLKHAEMWKECASEHRQLAKWLKELKAYESDDEICKYCTHTHNADYCNACKHNTIFVDYFDLEVNADESDS